MSIYPLMTFIWAVFIVVAACTSDAHAFLYEQVVRFHFEPSPNYLDLFIVSDIQLTKEFYLIQKAGHMFTFGMLYVFHFLWMKRGGIAFLMTGISAAFSEVLQLYFNRNGRLFDIGVDVVGICLTFLICRIVAGKFIGSTQSHVKLH